MIPRQHQLFLDRAIEVLKQDARIQGLAAGGSFITQTMDEYSDLDLVIAVDPNSFPQVMESRLSIAESLGHLLSGFTGEHVGEPRLIICLYGPDPLHIDLKFVSSNDLGQRVEDPVILWERDQVFTKAFEQEAPHFPIPSMQWIEDRFWVWIHYGATKLGRGELFETVQFISFLREAVFGPLILMKNGQLPRGLRKIEQDAPESLETLKEMVPVYSRKSCIQSVRVMIEEYKHLRTHFDSEDLIYKTEAEKVAVDYFNTIADQDIQ